MKIERVDVTVVGTPWRELTMVEIVTEDGLTGIGEARMVNKTDTLIACIEEMTSRHMIGRDPRDVEDLAWRARWIEYGRVGEVTASALAVLDTACWDLMAQSLGTPLWSLLGGRTRQAVPAYANGWYQGDREPDRIAELARTVVDRGYTGLKLDPFGEASQQLSSAELRLSTAIVEAVRDAVGDDVRLMIEMHGRFTAANAIRAIEALAPFTPEWFEEPVSPYALEGLRRVRQATSAPIASGERAHTLTEVLPLLEEGLVDVIQADLTHCGGITGIRKVAALAEAYDVMLAPHNVCGPVGTAANVHIGISAPNFHVLEHFNDVADTWLSEIVDVGPTVDRRTGAFDVPTAPGLGLRLDKDACDRHPRTNSFFNLFVAGWEKRQPRKATA